jgi:hypothetical protein
LLSDHASGSIQLKAQRYSKDRNLTDNTKGGSQWETKAAKKTKRRARNKKPANRQKI